MEPKRRRFNRVCLFDAGIVNSSIQAFFETENAPLFS